MKPAKLSSIVLGVLFASLAGCGGPPAETGPTRFALTGKVTFGGQPLDGGNIAFLPPTETTELRVAGGPIVNGTFTIPQEKGANAGSYRVEIRALKPTGKKVPDPDMGGEIDVLAESIPPRYNDKSELTAEVGPDKTEFEFTLMPK